ncbi:hypothetical protein AKJ48_01995 [candidate division MSBL1 archaeon SCGC-AAA261O19]|uniref:Uncharacterized protein n=1 Tax=candidate division MSBL1 archaeon SCGC-AAA261O19 TaxID=1698277 RepID=A0A133VDU2_9EURY|nr:hypothetical protein AKJ48_01995 [candidate division MSBL1 archaeon SCGC-AAA261O19]
MSPENGVWEDNFTFKVTYMENENDLPSAGYPKVYIDNQPVNMIENDSTDNDVTNGKLYKYVWVTSKPDAGNHNFYFYAEDNQGENARAPENGAYGGPNVGKKSVLLLYEVSDPRPDPGENVVFSGYLKTADENLGVVGENVVLYEVLSENTVEVKSVITGENGYYAISLNVSSKRVGSYFIKFTANDYYKETGTPRLYVNSLDKPFILGVAIISILVVMLVLFFLLSRGVAKEQFAKPLLIALAVGVLLQFIGAGFIALAVAGGIAGYLFSKRTGKWTEHLRIGIMTGVLLALVYGIVFSLVLAESPELLGLEYSITQGEIFSIISAQTIYFLAFYNLLTGIGAMLGGIIGGPSKSRD